MAEKNTRISMLYSDAVSLTIGLYGNRINNIDQVDSALGFAKKEFGPSGTQAGRRWFYRLREKVSYEDQELRSSTNNKMYALIPKKTLWCDIYFRDPRDATWFQLKKNSLSSQLS